MNSLFFNQKIRYFFNPAYLLVYLTYFIRIFSLLDFTDEMQYYLQINELNKYGSLFQSDLYIQQLIYAIFYPFNKIYFILNGSNGLILFNRILLTIVFLFLMFYAKKIFLRNGSSSIWANWTSALLGLMPSIAIYAISYNTICFVGISLFLLILSKDWNNRDLLAISFITLITLIANPTIGLCILLISLLRFIKENNKSFLSKYLLIFSFLLFIFLLYLNQISNYETIKMSLDFSKGFGVGENWRFQYFFWPGILIYNFFTYRVLITKRFNNLNFYSTFKAISYLAIIFSFIILIPEFIYYFFPEIRQIYQPLQKIIFLYLLFLMAFLSQLTLKLSNKKKLSTKNKNWIIFSITIFILGTSLTSTNGFYMALHISLLSIPICIGLSGKDFYYGEMVN